MTKDIQSRMDRHKKKPKKKNKFTWKKLILAILLVFLLIGLSVAGLFTYYIATAPELDLEKLADPFSSRIYDKDGNLVTDLGSERRIKVTFDDLPDVLIDAVLATEDVRFFDHIGIDFRRIGGAVLANIKRGFGSEGASTITQQVVENSFITTGKKKLKSKVQEQWLALKLERELSKEEILEIYLNKIFYGAGAYGVAKAAETFFGKTNLHDLTLVEAAILAGLPQRPSAYNPYENPELTKGRLDTVLKLMVRHGKITEEEAEEARQVDITSLLSGRKQTTTRYDAFIQQVKQEISQKLEDTDLYEDGLKIYTTLDPKAQDYVEFLLTDSEENPINYINEDLQAGMTVLDTQTGAILAIGGGRNRENIDEYNYAIHAKRQPGSTFKPLLVFAPAIEFNKISTYHQLNDDAPLEIAASTPIRNVDRRYRGWVSARTALASSINVPTVKLFEEIGKEDNYSNAKEFAERLGIQFPTDPINVREAIGGHETSVSTLQLAGAFRPFGNDGIYNEPYAITKVEYPDGRVVELKPQPEPVMSDYTAYMVTDMLKDAVTQGTGRTYANIPDLPVAGKTGTTNISSELGGGANNSWFVGYTTNFTISVWVGYDENNRSLVDGQFSIAQRLFRHTMTHLSDGIETADFKKPSSVVEVAIERGTNPPKLPSAHTPKDRIITELFVKGYEPSEVSEVYDKVDSVSSLKASFNHDERLIEVTWNYSGEANFEVYATINDGTKRLLTTTDSTSFDISNVELGATYEIEVVAVDVNNPSKKSDPVSTVIRLPDEQDDQGDNNENNTEDNEQGQALNPVDNLHAVYNVQTDSIDVSWSYTGPPARFLVNVNGQELTIDQQFFQMVEIEYNQTYLITVTPIGTRGAQAGLYGPEKAVEIYVSEPVDGESDNNES